MRSSVSERSRTNHGTGRLRSGLAVVVAIGATFLFLGPALLVHASPSGAAVARVRKPIDVMVVVDTSKRDIPFHFASIQRAAVSAIRSMPAEARVGVVSTGPFPAVIRPLARNRSASMTSISTLRSVGQAQIFDAVSLAIDQFDTITLPTRTVVIVSDGRSSGNSVSLTELKQKLVAEKVTIDFVTIDVSPPNEPLIRALLTSKSARVHIGELNTLAGQISARSEVVLTSSNTGRGFHVPSFVLIGLAALLLLGAVGVLAAIMSEPKNIKINAEGLVVEGRAGATPVGEVSEKLSIAIDRALDRQGRSSGINDALETAGINLRPGEYVLLVGALMVGGGGFTYAAKGPIVGLAATLFILMAGFMVLRMKAGRRRNAFGTQLGDVLQLLSSSMRAGQSLMQALDAVSREAESPAAEEFRRVIVETRFGRDLLDSLHALAARMECEDLTWVIPAIEINRTVGGDLGEVLDNVGQTIRDRADVRRQIKTLSAEGRISAYVLLAMPIGLALFLKTTNPTYMEALFHGTGLYLLAAAGVLMTIGTLWMLQLCKIKF